MAKIHHYGNTLYPKLEAMTAIRDRLAWLRRYPYCHQRRRMFDWFRHVAGFAANVGFDMEISGPTGSANSTPGSGPTGSWPGPIRRWTAMWTLPVPAIPWRREHGRLGQGSSAQPRHRRDPLALGRVPVDTEQGEVTCQHLVNAAGCYAREVGKWLGVDTPITNMEHQYLVTEPLSEFKDSPVELPVMRDPATAGYYRQEQKAGLVGIYEHVGAREAWADRGGWPAWASENELFCRRSRPHRALA